MSVDKKQLKSVQQWIQKDYPSLHASAEWIQSATEYVASTSDHQPPRTPDLITGVGYQLLHAELAQLRDRSYRTSARIEARCQVDETSTGRGKPEDPDFEMDQIKRGMLAPVIGTGTSFKGAADEGEMLVEITAMTDVGVAAQTLLEVTNSRQQALKTESGRIMLAELMQNKIAAAAGGGAAAVRSRSASPTKAASNSSGPGAAVEPAGAGADDEHLGAEEEMMRASIVYPRSMLLLELDDGFSEPARRKPIQALEMERIPELSLDGTPLGTKIAICNAVVRDGVIMLKRNNVTVKGGGAIEYEERAEEQLLARLCEQLGAQKEHQRPPPPSPMKIGVSAAPTSPAAKSKRKASAVATKPTATRKAAVQSKNKTKQAQPESVDLSMDDAAMRDLIGDGVSNGPIVLSD